MTDDTTRCSLAIAFASSAARTVALSADLERRLLQLTDDARRAWPKIRVSDEDFVRHLGQCVTMSDAEIEEGDVSLEGLRAGELLVACGCARGDPAAIRIFEEQFLPEAIQIHRRAGRPTDEREFLQDMRDRLLVAAKGHPPRIGGFAGRGELRNWVRIAAHRALVDGFRARGRATDLSESTSTDLADSTGSDPELHVLRATYRDDFQAAFEGAFGRLEPGQRTLLRYRYLDGLEVNQIATIDGRHRVSVSRALRRAREALMEHLRCDLAQRLHLRASEADSVVKLMRSQLHVSLSRLLETRDP